MTVRRGQKIQPRPGRGSVRKLGFDHVASQIQKNRPAV